MAKILNDGKVEYLGGSVTSNSSFVAFDVETANEDRGSICAVGAVQVRDGVVESGRHWLCKPPEPVEEFSPFNIRIHGITPEMVEDQPRFGQVWHEVQQYIGDQIVVAHNASFDTGAARAACDYSGLPWPTWDYACTLVMARRCLELISYKLPLVAQHLGISMGRHHDALADAKAAAEIMLALVEQCGKADLVEALNSVKVVLGRQSLTEWQGCHHVKQTKNLITPEVVAGADPDHPLYGQVMVFTGGLSTMTRQTAWNHVAALGAIPSPGINKSTTMLVIGDGFRGENMAEFATSKAQKAAKLRNLGQPIEVITEDDLIALIYSSPNSGKRSLDK